MLSSELRSYLYSRGAKYFKENSRGLKKNPQVQKYLRFSLKSALSKFQNAYIHGASFLHASGASSTFFCLLPRDSQLQEIFALAGCIVRSTARRRFTHVLL